MAAQFFSSAVKSFTSNIGSNYSISSTPSSTSGPWKIYDAKKKSTGKAASVFVFEKKSLEPQGGGFAPRSTGGTVKRAHEEVVERLKKEASSLARLRHPSILELAEPVEETRSGGLMFATEPVSASLAGLLQEKDEQERGGGPGGRSSRYVVEEDGTRRRRELEIDELEIQKGLLQVAKGLDFLHESAGLVHGNLTPEAIFVNAKSDWKISGLGFCSPPDNSTKPTSVTPISLSEVLNHDPRLPRSVQLNIDYASPDFIMDTNLNTLADMFSLGLLVIALFNSPHRSPLETNQSPSTYKRLFASSSSIPTQNNGFLCKGKLPRDIAHGLLPRLITRRPAQRLNAREFQEAQYFDNILVSTIRFLDSLPAKTPAEKSQFMRGLPRVLNQFPKSVLEKKVLPALLEEMKDRELLSIVLQNIFKILTMVPSGKRAFCDKVLPRLREVFLGSGTSAKPPQADRDSAKEAGLMIILENMKLMSENCTGKEFKDDVLPLIVLALQSPTHSLVDAALRTLPVIIYVLDFSTIKNEFFPIVANVFAKTTSMGIKIRGLQAFRTLCGGGIAEDAGDGLDGFGADRPKQKQNAAVLDKYTIQEKVVPLLKAIKTKEPAVMMASLDVFQEVGKIADSDFLAMEVLPILWNFSLGPLLNLQQFQAFMALIKQSSTRIEQEQTRKLQELSTGNTASAARADDFMSFGGISPANGTSANGDEADFESLVTGRPTNSFSAGDSFDAGWATSSTATSPPVSAGLQPPATRPNNPRTQSVQSSSSAAPTFNWSTPPPPQQTSTPPPRMGMGMGAQTLQPSQSTYRSATPDHSSSSLGGFAALKPQSTGGTGTMNGWGSSSMTSNSSAFSLPLQPSRPQQQQQTPSGGLMNMGILSSQQQHQSSLNSTTVDWGAAARQQQMGTPATGLNRFAQQSTSGSSPYSGFGIAPPPARQASLGSFGGAGAGMAQPQQQQQQQQQGQRKGLDQYESLL
ncbi:Protein kinase-like protein SCY1 [Lasiodiplodia hormozganensis]|uniref:Protein kinase-like protein SCY1 n=1 Tax=Lasiodiplodia hormozganensis TaxID=869390 RepID=A0AA39XU95_9PEZI|nr:Protein kinase-like protein SCY1 [Lasiodiplodia hormozganensis]